MAWQERSSDAVNISQQQQVDCHNSTWNQRQACRSHGLQQKHGCSGCGRPDAAVLPGGEVKKVNLVQEAISASSELNSAELLHPIQEAEPWIKPDASGLHSETHFTANRVICSRSYSTAKGSAVKKSCRGSTASDRKILYQADSS